MKKTLFGLLVLSTLFSAVGMLAAISATAVWELRTGGNDANGGFYVPGAGTDYSVQDAAQLSLTDVVANGTTTLTSATGGFTSDMLNNGICISGGSGSLAQTHRQVTGFTDANTITVDAVVASGTGITGKLGGGKFSPEGVAAGVVAGNDVMVKAGTFSRSTTWTLTLAGGANKIRFIGYDTVRTVDNILLSAYRPVITTATNSTKMVTTNNASNLSFRNINWSNTATTRSSFHDNLTATSSSLTFTLCDFDGFTTIATSTTSSTTAADIYFYGCEIKNFTSTGFVRNHSSATLTLENCYVHGGSSTAIQTIDAVITLRNTIIANNSGRGVYGSDVAGSGALNASGCTFYKNGTANVEFLYTGSSTTVGIVTWANNIVYGSTDGVKQASGHDRQARRFAAHNAYGGASGNNKLNFSDARGDITLTANPFVDGDNGDFRLNNTAGGGAAVRGMAFPTIFPGGTSNYRDLGPLEHDPGAAVAAETSWGYVQ